MEIRIELHDLKELQDAFKRSPDIAREEYSRALERSAFKIEGDAKRNAPVNKQSGGGNLRQSIKSRMEGRSRAVIEARAKYAAYVDQGTRPHIISVVNKKVLANRRTGQIFGRRVHHPGTKSQPFFTNSVKNNEGYVNDQFKAALQNTLNRIR